MIAILDYGVGNISAIYNMFKKIGVSATISSDPDVIKQADKYLLPGVGSFDYGINQLRNSTFFDIFEKEVLLNKKPTLGICLGMQLLTNSSEEGKEKGLGWINAETIKFDLANKNLSIPHMGWNEVIPETASGLFQDLAENRFYFVHSYHVRCSKDTNVLATSNYGGKFTCGINENNIFGVQFHPEKSHKFGMKLLQNFDQLPC